MATIPNNRSGTGDYRLINRVLFLLGLILCLLGMAGVRYLASLQQPEALLPHIFDQGVRVQEQFNLYARTINFSLLALAGLLLVLSSLVVWALRWWSPKAGSA